MHLCAPKFPCPVPEPVEIDFPDCKKISIPSLVQNVCIEATDPNALTRFLHATGTVPEPVLCS